MCAWGGVCQKVCWDTHPLLRHPPWTELLTHACENITFLQLLLRVVKIKCFLFLLSYSLPFAAHIFAKFWGGVQIKLLLITDMSRCLNRFIRSNSIHCVLSLSIANYRYVRMDLLELWHLQRVCDYQSGFARL